MSKKTPGNSRVFLFPRMIMTSNLIKYKIGQLVIRYASELNLVAVIYATISPSFHVYAINPGGLGGRAPINYS
jgi:hypothetical protein